VVRVRDPRFLALTVLNGVLYLHSILLTIVLPLWIATRTAAPPAMIGVVVVINTVMAIVLQVPLSGGSADIRSAARRQQWAGWCLAGCCLLAALAARVAGVAAVAPLVAAAAVLTLGEIWQSVGAWRLSYALSPEHQRAYYLSVYQLGKSGATAVGPALLTWAVIRNGTFGWMGLAAFFALAGLAVVLITAGLAGPRAAASASPGPLSDAKHE
jgi:MFS family permease